MNFQARPIFVRLHNAADGEPLFVNIAHIVAVVKNPKSPNTLVETTSRTYPEGVWISVQESPHQVVCLMLAEVRG